MAVEQLDNELNIYQLIGGDISRNYLNVKNIKKEIRVAIPASIVSVNYKEMTCTCQPLIRENLQSTNGVTKQVQLPMLVDVPIVYPSSSGFQITFPLSVGDEGLVVFADMCIDAWWQSGGVQNQFEERRHDLSDGFFIPAMMSQKKKVYVNGVTITSKPAGKTNIDGVNIVALKKQVDELQEAYERKMAEVDSAIQNLQQQCSNLDERVRRLEGRL